MAPSTTSPIVLLILSGVSVIATLVIGIPSGIMAALALMRARRDPGASARLSKSGWITYAVNAVVGLVVIVAWVMWMRRR